MRGIYSSGQIKVLTVRPEEAALVLAERKRPASCHERVRSRVADESENECERWRDDSRRLVTKLMG